MDATRTIHCDELGDARPAEDVERSGTPAIPELEPDPRLDPFGDHRIAPDSEAGLLLEIVLNSLRSDSAGWQDRLGEVARILTEHASDVLAPPDDGNREVTEADVGLLFVLACTACSSRRYPRAELHAALALWLLVQSEIARQEQREADGLRLRKACLWCLPDLFISSVEARGRRHRSSISRIGTDARHEFNRQRRARVLSDFHAGSWRCKNAAAETLAERHALSVSTVRKFLQGA